MSTRSQIFTKFCTMLYIINACCICRLNSVPNTLPPAQPVTTSGFDTTSHVELATEHASLFVVGHCSIHLDLLENMRICQIQDAVEWAKI